MLFLNYIYACKGTKIINRTGQQQKRHLTDVSLAVAALGANKNSLLNDLRFMGFLFESLVIHELRVYAQANDAKVFRWGFRQLFILIKNAS